MESNAIKILAIDDNYDNLITIKALVSEAFPNAIVMLASTGKEGFKLAASEDPDVILLDIIMPEMDGFEVCQKLKSDKQLCDIPVVFVTALKGEKESRIRGLEVGAEAFLAKPIDESELVAQIRAMVKIKKSNIERRDENVRLAALVDDRTAELKRTHLATLNLLEDLKNEIEERRKAEKNLQQVARLYAVLSQINQVIVRTKTSDELFKSVCQLAIDYGQFLMGWIGIYDEKNKRITPYTFAGYEEGYLDNIKIFPYDSTYGKGATGAAFREQKMQFCNDIATDPLMEPWRDEAMKRGYRSIFATPILLKGKSFGVLTFYAPEINYFNEEEQKLLLELSENISFALEAIDSELERKKYEIALEQSRIELKTIYDYAPVMMCVIDSDRNILFANNAFTSLTKISDKNLVKGRIGNVIGCINALTNPRGCGYGDACADCKLHSAIESTFKTGTGRNNIEYQSTLEIAGQNRRVSFLGSTALIKTKNSKNLLLCIHDITSRKLTEEALQKSETLLRTFIDNTPFEIWARDNESVGILENKKFVNHYGSIIGQTPSSNSKIDSDTKKLWEYNNNRVFAGEIIDEEYDYKIKGQKRSIQQIIFPIKNNNHTIGIAGFNIDITDRKIAEEKIRENNLRLELAMQVANMAWWEMNINTGQVSFGKQKTDMLGFSHRKFTHYMDFMELVHPDDFEQTMTAMHNHLYGKANRYETEYRISTSAGDYKWFYDVGSISKRDENGKPLIVSGLVLDITDRKEAESELATQKRFFEQMFMQSSLSTQILDKEGWCESVNPKYSKLFHIEAKDVEGKNYNIFKDKELIEKGLTPKLENVFKDGRSEDWELIFDIDLTADSQNSEGKEKKKVCFSNWAYPIFDHNNEISHVIIQHNDITDRKNAEDALHESQEQMKMFAAHLQNIREEEKNSLAREIHDDLGQILIAIKIDVGILKQNILKTIPEKDSEDLKEKFLDLHNLVDSTLKSARRIMTDLRPEVLDLLGFIETVKQLLKSFQERFKITCTFENNLSDLKLNSQQSVALYRIVQEALNNVAKHSKATEVNVILKQQNDTFSLEIIDNGIGFDVNNRKNVDSYGLIGMKERVFLLEGELSISSKKDIGTNIKIVVPYLNSQLRFDI